MSVYVDCFLETTSAYGDLKRYKLNILISKLSILHWDFLQATCSGDEQYNLLPGSPDGGPQKKGRKHEVCIIQCFIFLYNLEFI